MHTYLQTLHLTADPNDEVEVHFDYEHGGEEVRIVVNGNTVFSIGAIPLRHLYTCGVPLQDQ